MVVNPGACFFLQQTRVLQAVAGQAVLCYFFTKPIVIWHLWPLISNWKIYSKPCYFKTDTITNLSAWPCGPFGHLGPVRAYLAHSGISGQFGQFGPFAPAWANLSKFTKQQANKTTSQQTSKATNKPTNPQIKKYD